MSDTIDKVAERLTTLEVTVAHGFHDLQPRFQTINERFLDAELRDLALSRKIDVNTESVRGDLKTVLDAVSSLADEIRRGFDSIRQEHHADRAVVTAAVEQHARRLREIEKL
jgi:hypothetical protein